MIATPIIANTPCWRWQIMREPRERIWSRRIRRRYLLNDLPIRPSETGLRGRGKDIVMRTHDTSPHTHPRIEPAFVGAGSRTAEPRSASIHLLNSATRAGRHRSFVRSTQTPAALRNEMAELVADIDGLPVLVRLLVPAEMSSDLAAKDADIRSRLSSMLERMVDRIGGSLRSDARSRQPLAIVELTSGEQPLHRMRTPRNETVLRVGSLELDLVDRTAKRGDRQIDLRPREFRLLKYMMQRSDELLTRATLFKEVWHYKFVPETNLVDVHMGRVRRKVDGPNDPQMIRSVRGVGFVLTANPVAQGPEPRPAAVADLHL
ncbi:MAG TPA: winged helix-turn-helix domain-containing protein [Bradyrhizobium sp.]|nr:winged helix-turn-helix domain-containing protein [Bradyrhizobium sp.]